MPQQAARQAWDTDGADGTGCMFAATPDENGEEPFVKACLLNLKVLT